MILNRTGSDYEHHLFRILQKLRQNCKNFFSPASCLFGFLFIKLKVPRKIRKNDLDGIDDVLRALGSSISYSFASFAEGDILESGTKICKTAAIFGNNVNDYNSKLDLIYGQNYVSHFWIETHRI